MTSALNITEIEGKQKKLISAINRTVEQWPSGDLPSILIMNEDQYQTLKRSRCMGDVKEWRTVPAEQRIWVTHLNAMEIRIK